MKSAVLLGLLWIGLLPLPAQTALSKLPRVVLFGREYVRLDTWARANGFRLTWTSKTDCKVTTAYSTLLFSVDSRRMALNGIDLWLSFPIAARQGLAYISPIDLSTAIQPVLFPPKPPPGKTIRTICLDPGHGGRDPGNREGRQQEKAYTLLLGREVSAQLSRAGFRVSLTRVGDTSLELPTRPDVARRRGADLFLSLHFNSADGLGGRTVHGTEVYCLTPARASSTNARGEGGNTGAVPGNRQDSQNMLLGYHLQKALVRNLGTEDRGVRRARFVVLKSAEMPAVLIEAGFMTHPIESKRIYSADYRRQLAEAIVNGVVAYQRAVER